MKTLSIPEATLDLASVLARAVAGEEIGILSGDAVVVLHPLTRAHEAIEEVGAATPLEALRQLQQKARLSPAQARHYLEEVRAERLAAGERTVAG